MASERQSLLDCGKRSDFVSQQASALIGNLHPKPEGERPLSQRASERGHARLSPSNPTIFNFIVAGLERVDHMLVAQFGVQVGCPCQKDDNT